MSQARQGKYLRKVDFNLKYKEKMEALNTINVKKKEKKGKRKLKEVI